MSLKNNLTSEIMNKKSDKNDYYGIHQILNMELSIRNK